MELIEYVNKFEEVNVLVLGDIMLDEYLLGTSTRLSPEAPVPVVKIDKITGNLGGAGNVVNNLIGLGAETNACGVIGDDFQGEVISKTICLLSLS